MSEQKKIPNPDGRKGCEAHRNLIITIEKEVKDKDLEARKEFAVKINEAKKRYLDVAGLDKITKEIVELHQVGVQTQAGIPVKRERDAIKDIEEAAGITVEFHAYNQTKNYEQQSN